jgi:hypothetical protein
MLTRGDAVSCSLLWRLSSLFFDVLYVKIRILLPSILVTKDCMSAFISVLLKPMFFRWLLNLVVSGEWFLRSSKLCLVMTFACAPFSWCLSSAISGGQRSIKRKKGDFRVLHCNFIFFVLFCVKLFFIFMIDCFPRYESLPTKPVQYRGQGAWPRSWLLLAVGSPARTGKIEQSSVLMQKTPWPLAESTRCPNKDPDPASNGAAAAGRATRPSSCR